VVPASADALAVLEKLRTAQVPVALVHDEYGSFEGLVTPADLLETIAGSFRSHYEDEGEPKVTERADGSYLIAGGMAADEMAELLAIALPQDRQFHTAAGFVLNALQHIPRTGEHFEAKGWRFEVVDLDGNRVDKILVTRPVGRRAKGGA
jgi:putative hemolysin